MTGVEVLAFVYVCCGLAVAAKAVDLLMIRPVDGVNPQRRRSMVERARRFRDTEGSAFAVAFGIFVLLTVLLWPIPVVNGVRWRLRERRR